MKLSLFGYNRKETDEYFSYLNETGAAQADQIADLKEKLAAAEKTAAEYQKLDALSRGALDAQKAELDTQKAELDTQKAALDTQKAALDALRAESDAQKTENDTLRAENDDLRQRLADLEQQLRTQKPAFEADKLGFIFAVAYKDIENKNKAVSAKIRDYADMMFDRMSEYRQQVASIVGAVTEMQNRQKEELQRLCDEAAEQLDRLTEASAATIDDMQKIEASRRSICGEIDNMMRETINTGGDPLVIGSTEPPLGE